MNKSKLEAAMEELMKIPSYCEASSLTLCRVTLKDGRGAIVRIEITTEEDEVEDANIWEPK